MADGSITIDILAKTDKFDKQIKDFEKKISKEEDKKIEIEAKIEIAEEQLKAYDEAKQKVKEYKQKLVELRQERNRLFKENPNLAVQMDTPQYAKIKQDIQEVSALLQQENKEILSQESSIDKTANSLEKLKSSHEEINGKITEYKSKIESIKLTKQQEEVKKLKDSFNNVGSSIQDTINRVGKLALGIFGIRSAYMALRRASSELASYDKQYAANLEYIRFVLTQAIAPVLRGIVELAMKLLAYINLIAQAWFGVNLFSKGSAENFNKMKASAGGVSKAVKQIKKDLLGFDEINVLTDQSDTGTRAGAGGVGAVMPSFDISDWQGEVPKWLKWIMDNKDKVLGFLKALGIAIAALKLVKWFSDIAGGVSKLFSGITKIVPKIAKFITTNAKLAAGIGLLVTGIITLVSSIAILIFNWDDLDTKHKILLAALAAVGAAFIALGYAIATGLSVATLGVGALIAGIIALVAAIATFVIKCATEEKAIKSVQKAQEDLKKAQDDLKTSTDEYIDAVDRATDAEKKLKEAEQKTKLSGEELYNQVERGILDYRDMTDEQKEVYKAYRDNLKAQEDLKLATDNLAQSKRNEKQASWDLQIATANETGNFYKLRDAVVNAFRKGELSAEEARDVLERAMSDMSSTAAEVFLEDIPYDIKSGLNPDKYQTTWQKFKKGWNDFWDGLKKKLNIDVSANYRNNMTGFSGASHSFATGGIFYPSKIPKLASGGIVNLPGRGALYNGAYIGERGAEAVVPLTDNQQMELLGATIGRYITVNANIVNSMNGRVISRELKQIQNEQDFAYNF